MIRLTLIFILLSVTSAFAKPYTVDYKNSKLEFSGKHAGQTFKGTFKKWKADIDFNSEKPEESKISATFETASAATGNPLYDGTLPKDDWFNVKNHPTAQFTIKMVAKNDDGSYKADGLLKIRQIEQPVTFNFKLDETNAKQVKAEAKLKLDRLAFELGKKSDPKAEWVDKEIEIKLTILAAPAE